MTEEENVTLSLIPVPRQVLYRVPGLCQNKHSNVGTQKNLMKYREFFLSVSPDNSIEFV